MMRPSATVIWVSLVSACARDDAEHHYLDGLKVIEDFDEPICAGTFAFLERRLSMLERATGLSTPPTNARRPPRLGQRPTSGRRD
jgi:hypothetical protein